MIFIKFIRENQAIFNLQINIEQREFNFIVRVNHYDNTYIVSSAPTIYLSFQKEIKKYFPWFGNSKKIKKLTGLTVEHHDEDCWTIPEFTSFDDLDKFIKYLNNYSEI